MMEDLRAHALPSEKLLAALNTSPEGLSEEEARRRIEIYGRNELETQKESLWSVLLRQFRNPLVYILLLASVIALSVGERVDFFLIVGIVLANALIGFFQEYKAITSLESLRKYTELKVRVLRDRTVREVPSSLLVPGDVVLVEEGDVVPADIRLLRSEGLLVDESVLTGESIPTEKTADAVLPEDTPIYERTNVIFKGTLVVRGHAEGVVYATGPRTEFGKISVRAGETSPETPLTRALKTFSRKWMAVLLLILLLLFLIGVLQGRSLYEVSMLIIAELVSAVPEGLPIVITLVLVVGAVRLSRRKTYIRYLPAAETLGSTTYIATDKTGTVTEGRLRVADAHVLRREELFLISALCNNSDGERGDPVETALLRWLEKEGVSWKALREKYPRVYELPFDTRKRYMATVNRKGDSYLLLVKGAFESILALTGSRDPEAVRVHDSMAERGLRVLAFAFAEVDYVPETPEEVTLRLAGLVGFIDPPKEGVRSAVETARRAGIRVVMITGDNLKTARAIAEEVGIYREGDWVIEGRKLESYTDEELYTALRRVTVVARALPEDKYRIVRVLQSRGEVVAVTGDGVNDVPALKVADIGIAMGSGAQAAKDVAKMVITDNNLAVIVDAIRWGRIIARNIRRAIHYLLSASFGEVLLLSFAFILKLPFPLYPTQILWINLVTDGVQDKTFPFNREESDVMREKPRRPERVFIDNRQMVDILSTAGFTGTVNLLLFLFLLKHTSYEIAVSTVFTSMVVNQWIIGVQTVRELPFLHKPWRNFTLNPYIFLGILLGLLLQSLVLYVFPEYMHAHPLSLEEWKLVALTSAGVFLFIELRKLLWLLLQKTGGSGREA